MNRVLFYYFLLLIPDLIPSLIWMLGLTTPPGDHYESLRFADILYYSTGYWVNSVSLPYLGFAAITLWRSWDKTANQLQKSSWRLPLFFAPAFLPVFYLTNQRPGLAYLRAPLFAFFIMLCVIALGYFYVLLAHVLTWTLQQMRVVGD